MPSNFLEINNEPSFKCKSGLFGALESCGIPISQGLLVNMTELINCEVSHTKKHRFKIPLTYFFVVTG